ncbi:MAG: hypothetical protein CL424_11550 [Acidimicrobiaceae bacterium]|nr:hypothetical protein [Acidimicrobiaceae bacterium]
MNAHSPAPERSWPIVADRGRRRAPDRRRYAGAGHSGCSVGDVSAQAWFSLDEVSVVPGAPTSMLLSVENVGDRTESYTVIPAGLTAPWTTITRPNVTLFGGSQDVIEVVVRPPAIYSTTAGPTTVAVRVVSQADPDDEVIAETLADVASFDDRRITTLQPVRRARRRATFEFMVENHGNNLANCRLHLVDRTNRVDGTFDPPAVGVAPGSTSLVRLNAKVGGGRFRRSERQLDFEIEATEPDHEPASGLATLIQPPTLSARFLGRALATGAVIAAVIAAWFGVVRPELRDAADRAVDERLDELTVEPSVTTVPSTVPVPIDEPDVVIGGDEPGEPVSYRIAVDVGVNQERSESVTVPPDSEFRMTDLVLQNPNGDLGTAQLLRNGEILYEFDLGSMSSANEFQPRISPIPFAPSDNIVLSVECTVVGQTSGTGCDVAVLLGGELVVADHDGT